MRLKILIASSVLFIAPAAYAQDSGQFDPAAAVQDFLTDPAYIGADTATIGSLSTDGDIITVNDVSLGWSVKVGEGDGAETITASVKMPSLVIDTLGFSNDLYTFGKITLPTTDILVQGTGGDFPIKYALTIANHEMTDVSWAPFPKIANDPNTPVSRFSPLFLWYLTQSFQSASVGDVTGEFTMGEDTQNVQYGGMSVGPVTNGRYEKFEYGPISLTQEITSPDGSPAQLDVSYGRVTLTGVDMAPLIHWYAGGGEAGSQTVIAKTELDGATITGPEGLKVSFGPMVGDDTTIDPSRGPILQQLDPIVVALMAGNEPQPQTIIPLVLNIYSAIGVKHLGMSDIAISGPGVTAGLANVVLSNANANGIERFAIEGLSVDTPQGKGQLGTFEFTDIAFPTREAFMEFVQASMMGAPPTPAQMKGLPTLGGLAVKGLDVTTPIPTMASIKLGEFSLSQSAFVGAIPTNIAILLSGLELPAALLDDPQASAILSAIGADPVKADGKLNLSWAEAGGAITLDEDLMVAGVGRLTTTAQVGGIPRAVIEDPTRAQEAMATASIGGVSLTYQDAGLTPFLLGMMSEGAGISADQFAQGITQQIEMQIAGITGDQSLASNVAGTLRDYLADPKNISVSANPSAPVPVAQLIGAAMTAPAQIVNLLNITIAANR